MDRELDALDKRILDLLQDRFPMVEEPFAAIARQVETDEKTVLARVAELKAKPRPIIRQISAIFDTNSLGYQSSLVAAKIDPARLDEAAAEISKHPGVSHNYRRENAFNLWYTLAVPPDSKLGLQGTIDKLHALSGAISTRTMPTLKRYKIGVRLNLSGDDEIPARAPSAHNHDTTLPPLTEAEKRMIRVLQQDMPIISRPFDQWATQAGLSAKDLLDAVARFESQKRMRRFAAVLHHREVGFTANGMGTWVVPPEQRESFGAAAAGFPEVSHCYLRPSYPDWPYNIFTMVHAPTNAACEDVLRRISAATEITEYACLYSTREYKKVRVQYFMADIEEWEVSA